MNDNEEDIENIEEDYEEDSEEDHDEENEENITIIENNEGMLQESAENTPRRSQRTKKFPDRYNDYAFLTYEEVMNSKDKRRWIKAMQEEKKSLEENETWKFVNIDEAKGKKCLTSRWVFQVKEEGRYKARLVARGCEQGNNIDYEKLYSPVVNSAALRMLFALAAHYNWNYIKFDIKTAFLYGELEEEIFMYLPEGYGNEKNKICKLRKAIYGLKQASHNWNKKFTEILKKHQLKQLLTEKCIFKKEDNSALLAIHVDDGILFGRNLQDLKNLLSKLKNVFEIIINENPSSFLGLEIEKQENSIRLNQQNYSGKVLDTYGMNNAKPVDTPMLVNKEMNDEGSRTKSFPFREAVGSLLYLTAKTRPDLSYAVTYNSRNIQNPSDIDITNVKRILRYLHGTKHLGIAYYNKSNVEILKGYCDADYAGDIRSRKSTHQDI